MKGKTEMIIRLKDKDALKDKETGKLYWKCPYSLFVNYARENECYGKTEPRIFSPSKHELFAASYNIPCSNKGHSLWAFNTSAKVKNMETWLYDTVDEIIFPAYGY